MQKQGSGAMMLLALLTFGGMLALFSQAGVSDTSAQSRLNPGSRAIPSEVPHAMRDAGQRFSREALPGSEKTTRAKRLRLECH